MADIKIGISTEGVQKAKTDLNSVKDAGERLVATNEKVETSNAKINASYRGMGGNIRNASYQLQDFLVQVQGGTSITTSLSQQLPQLLSGFGLIGVVAGVAAAGLGIIITNLDLFATKLDKATKVQKTANDELRKTVDIFDQFSESTKLITTKSANYVEEWVIAFRKANAEAKQGLLERLELQTALAEIAAQEARQAYANLLVKRGLLGQEGIPGSEGYQGQGKDSAMMTAEQQVRQREEFLQRLQKLMRGDFSGAMQGGEKQESINITLQQRIEALQAEAKYIGVSNAERERGIMLAELEAQAKRAGLGLDQQQVQLLSDLIVARDAARSTEKIIEYTREQQREIDLLQLEGKAVSMTALQHKQLIDARKLEAQLTKDTIGIQPAQAEAYKENARLLFLQKQNLEQVNDAQSRTFEYGAKKATRAYLDDLTNVAKSTESLFSNAFKGIEDAMVSAFSTGKLSFKSMIDAMMQDITRLIIRQTLMKPLYSALGLGGGGSGSLFNLGASALNMFGNAGTALSYGTNIGSQQTAMLAAQDAGFPMATGTNYVPYDGFQATLHKGEAVVPAEYNPAAGGSGTSNITYSPVINIDSRTDQSQVRGLVERAIQQGQAELVDRINRGQVRIRT